MPFWDSRPTNPASLVNLLVGTSCVPLIWQEAPAKEKVEKWLSSAKTGLVEQWVECFFTWGSTSFSFVGWEMLFSSNYFCSRLRNKDSKQQYQLQFSYVSFPSCQKKSDQVCFYSKCLQKTIPCTEVAELPSEISQWQEELIFLIPLLSFPHSFFLHQKKKKNLEEEEDNYALAKGSWDKELAS